MSSAEAEPRSSEKMDRSPSSEQARTSSIDHNEDAEKAPLGITDERPRGDMRAVVWFLVAASVFSATFLFALDNTIVADVQPKVIESFGEVTKLPWISVAFPLGGVAMNLIWGKLFGQFDIKYTFIVTIIFFEIGSAICGAANNMDTFIVGRAICGFGGGGIYMGAMNIISVLTTIKERPGYLGLTGLCWGSGTVLGPVIGGAFGDSSATWRWAFYINLCIGAVMAPVWLFLIPSRDPRKGVRFWDRCKTIDYFGCLIFIGACTSGVMAISFGGALYAWGSGRIIGLFVCTGVLWVIFGVQQAFHIFTTREHQLFPIQFVLMWEHDIFFAQAASTISCAFIPIYFIPLFFSFVHGDTALDAGVRLLPFIFLMVGATIANGIIMGKTGYYMPWFLFGGALAIAGGALFYTIDINTSTSAIYGYSVLVAIGAGSVSQASISICQAKVAPSELAAATQFVGFGQIGGITLALAIANCIFINRAIIGIERVIPSAPHTEVVTAVSGTGGAFFATLDPTTREDVLKAIVAAISDCYVMVIAAGCLTTVLAIFMKRERLFIDGQNQG
ncbi:MAG: hypothetical protein Q9162_005647 [Coniocarpon cinnabarinum]